jgi:23S rRNA (cytidine1920-2'-O)/16S rRNA (cytidine1409-2'-O)-methyltransferase
VTRGGLKLDFALSVFHFNPAGMMAADLGCHRGGCTDCLLQHGAARVHAVDTGYGILDWKLRNDPRVVVHERTNLLHWTAPEPLDLAVIDAGWTPQRLSLPVALRLVKPGGVILTLVKPQYEAERSELDHGVLPPERLQPTLEKVREGLKPLGRAWEEAESPILGSGGNVEFWLAIHV